MYIYIYTLKTKHFWMCLIYSIYPVRICLPHELFYIYWNALPVRIVLDY